METFNQHLKPGHSFLLLAMLLLWWVNSDAQCTSCDYTISGNFSGNLNASNGDVICITSSGNLSGNLNGNNLTICNYGIISSQNFNPSNYTFYNYGTMNSSHLNINSNCVVNNFGSITLSGQLNINNGGTVNNHFVIDVAGHMHVNGVVTGNTSGGNARINVNGQTTINNGGVFGIIGNIDLCDAGNPSGGWDNKNGLVGNSVTYCQFGPSNEGEFISVQNGAWSSGSTWGNSGSIAGQSYPGVGDSVVIKSPHRVNIDIHGESAVINIEPSTRLRVLAHQSITVSDHIINNGLMVVNNGGSILQTDCSGEDKNSGSGTYKIKRTGVDTSICFNMWSSPIKSANISSTFNGTNPCDLFVFNGITQNWCYDYSPGYTTTCNGSPVVFSPSYCIPNGDGAMDIGRGYFAAGGGENKKVKKFLGQINNGEIKVAVYGTSHGHQTNWNDDDWNLIGNPYPSAISASAFWQENAIDNSRIFGAIHFWDDGAQGIYNQYDEYATWNSLGGVASSNSNVIPNGNIGSAQGFWIEAATNDSVVFNNCMRNTNNSQFFKGPKEENASTFYLKVTHGQGWQRNILLGYTANSSAGYDMAFDAHQISGNYPIQLASTIDSSKYVIQATKAPTWHKSSRIPLFIEVYQAGNFTLSSTMFTNVPDYVSVTLVDHQLHTQTNLKTDSISIPLNAYTPYWNRFEVVLSIPNSEWSGTGNFPQPSMGGNEAGNDSIVASISLEQAKLPRPILTSEGLIFQGRFSEAATCEVYDVLGRLLVHTTIPMGSSDLQVPISLSQGQPVIVRVQSATNYHTYKVSHQ